MRKKLLDCFDEIYILNLHGNSNIGETCLDGSKDQNVFDIKQGVGIATFVKKEKRVGETAVFYHDLYGLREVKYNYLLENDAKIVKWQKLVPKKPYYFFIPKDNTLVEQYGCFLALNKVFKIFSTGVNTMRDHFLVDFDKDNLVKRIKLFVSADLSDEEVKRTFRIKDTRDWNVREARLNLKIADILVLRYAYRPFDTRWVAYDETLIDRGCSRMKIMKHFFKENIGIATLKSTHTIGGFTNVFVTKFVNDGHLASDRSYIFPLYLYPDKTGNEQLEDKLSERTPNLNTGFVTCLSSALTSSLEVKNEVSHKVNISPEQILFYCYGIMYSNTYRKNYEEFLKIDFPRIPFTNDYNLFLEISKIGEEIGRLHLLESPLLNKIEAEYPVPGDHLMEKPMYGEKEQKLYINKNQYFGEVSKDVWEFTIGGYQVLDKYLKARKNKNLSQEEIEHLLKVITALKYTIEKMKVADELLKKIDLNNLVSTT